MKKSVKIIISSVPLGAGLAGELPRSSGYGSCLLDLDDDLFSSPCSTSPLSQAPRDLGRSWFVSQMEGSDGWCLTDPEDVLEYFTPQILGSVQGDLIIL